MGEVYEVFDVERRMVVALKTLRKLEPASLFKFKREFRALADVDHPNLVTLYELVSEQDECFFTMELVDGANFLDAVVDRGAGEEAMPTRSTADLSPVAQAAALARAHAESLDSDPDETLNTMCSSVTGGGDTPRAPVNQRWSDVELDFDRLRDTLAELVVGVRALHAAGYVHRDIKPSNVLVTQEGRVVVLDFGLVFDDEHQSGDIAGTPAYMAPEQGQLGARQTRAVDWYGVGVILYRVLTGTLPHVGSPADVLRAKQQTTPRTPTDFRSDIPPYLTELCRDLLSIDPSGRPDGDEISRRLQLAGANANATGDMAPRRRRATAPTELVGRDDQMAALDAAFDRARNACTVAMIRGESGMGKSELCNAFLRSVTSRDAVVLSGRCHERESMPYKAVDSLIDSLARHLQALEREDIEAACPDDVHLLARIFPVLRTVEAVASRRPGDSSVAVSDDFELRRRAFVALRELLVALAQTRPLVLYIDDIQWGDVDSAALIEALVRPPGAPKALLLLAYRKEDEQRSALLRLLREQLGRDDLAAGATTIDVGRLDGGNARELAKSLLESEGMSGEAAGIIGRESGGHPFFVRELVHFAAERESSQPEPGRMSLREVINARVARLDANAINLLQVICLAGRPLERHTAARVADIDAAAPLLQTLEGARFIRSAGMRATDLVEPFHGRIRDVVSAELDRDAGQAIHRRFAGAFEETSSRDPEMLAYHYARAGDSQRAAEYTLEAARLAAKSLAFERAVALYEQAIELGLPDGEDPGAVELALADALVNYGRTARAAEIFAEASKRATGLEAIELERKAALHFLQAGRVDQGKATLRSVLAKLDLSMPTKPLLSIVWRRARLGLRGYGHKVRPASEVDPMLLARIDVTAAAAFGLGMTETFLAASFQALNTLLALEAGEPMRLARALANEAALAFVTEANDAKGDRLLEIARGLTRDADKFVDGVMLYAEGMGAFHRGDMPRFRTCAATAAQSLRETHGMPWEKASCELYLQWANFWMGDLAELDANRGAAYDEAVARGDRLAQANFVVGAPGLSWLIRDAPAVGRERIDACMAPWHAVDAFTLPHYWEWIALTMLDLYQGNPTAAVERTDEVWPRIKKAMMLSFRAVKVESFMLRGHGFIARALAETPGEREPWLRKAGKCAQTIERKDVAWASPHANIMRGCIAAARGDRSAAISRLEAAEAMASRMLLQRYAAMRARGVLLGSDGEGSELVAEADAWFASQGVARPGAFARVFAPVADESPAAALSE